MARAPSRAARVLSRVAVGGDLTLVSLEIDDAHRASFTTPGQYVELAIDEKTGYFALASRALSAPWELIVRDSGDASRALLACDAGASVTVTAALGAGFRVDDAAGAPAIIAVTGSAVSVLRSLMFHREARGELAQTYALVGVRNAREVPLAAELAGWAKKGAHVWVSASVDERAAPDLVRAGRGYVQHTLIAEIAAGRVPKGAVVFAAGQEGMVKALAGSPHFASVYTNV